MWGWRMPVSYRDARMSLSQNIYTNLMEKNESDLNSQLAGLMKSRLILRKHNTIV